MTQSISLAEALKRKDCHYIYMKVHQHDESQYEVLLENNDPLYIYTIKERDRQQGVDEVLRAIGQALQTQYRNLDNLTGAFNFYTHTYQLNLLDTFTLDIDIQSLLQNEVYDLHECAYMNIPDTDIKELEEYVTTWLTRKTVQKATRTYSFAYGKNLVLTDEETRKLHEYLQTPFEV